MRNEKSAHISHFAVVVFQTDLNPFAGWGDDVEDTRRSAGLCEVLLSRILPVAADAFVPRQNENYAGLVVGLVVVTILGTVVVTFSLRVVDLGVMAFNGVLVRFQKQFNHRPILVIM